MADEFHKEDALKLLSGKKVLIIGDSNIRAVYKDLIWLMVKENLISTKALKTKTSDNTPFLGDTLLECTKLSRSRDFTEHRLYRSTKNDITIEYIFITNVYHKTIQTRLGNLQPMDVPDIVLINSTFWDIARWGPEGDQLFKKRIVNLMELFKKNLPPTTLVVWLTGLHPASSVKSYGLMPKQLEDICQNSLLQIQVMEANIFAASVVTEFGYNVLDLHFYVQLLIHRRFRDGLHFLPEAMRYISNLILTHIALEFRVQLPNRVNSIELHRMRKLIAEQDEEKRRNNNVSESISINFNQNDGARKVLSARRRYPKTVIPATVGQNTLTSAEKGDSLNFNVTYTENTTEENIRTASKRAIGVIEIAEDSNNDDAELQTQIETDLKNIYEEWQIGKSYKPLEKYFKSVDDYYTAVDNTLLPKILSLTGGMKKKKNGYNFGFNEQNDMNFQFNQNMGNPFDSNMISRSQCNQNNNFDFSNDHYSFHERPQNQCDDVFAWQNQARQEINVRNKMLWQHAINKFDRNMGNRNNFCMGSNNFGMSPNNFGMSPNNFGMSPNNFGMSPNNFGMSPNNFGMSPTNFGNGNNNFGNGNNNSVMRPKNFGKKKNNARKNPKNKTNKK